MTTEAIDHAQLATDRLAVADTFHRWALGMDLADAEMLASTSTEDVVVDIRAIGEVVGVDFPVLTGKQAVVGALLATVGPLDTSHAVSNVLAEVDGDRATAQALIAGQHFRPGDGRRPDRTAHALLMNRCTAELVRDGAVWRFSRFTLAPVWIQGDPAIITDAAAGSEAPTDPAPPSGPR